MNFIKSKPKPKSTAVLQFCGQIRWFVCLYFIHFRNNKLKHKDGTHRWIVQNEWKKCTMVQWISGAHSSGTVTLLRNQNKLSNHNFQFFEQTVHLSVFENHLGMCNKIFYEFMALGAVGVAHRGLKQPKKFINLRVKKDKCLENQKCYLDPK